MNNRVHEIISIVFSAPLMALYTIIILVFTYHINNVEILTSIIFLTIAPMIIPLYYSKRYRVAWDYPIRMLRIKPLAITTLNYVLGFIVAMAAGFSIYTKFLYLVYTILSSMLSAVTLFYKISVHVSGVMGPALYLAFIGLYIYSLAFFFISLLVGHSRIKLGRHTFDQVLSGYIISFIATYIAYVIH